MLKSVSRQTYADQVTESLIEFIASSQARPGEMLPSTAELAAQFGVSRPVVREALKALEGQGVITIVNGKGAVIRPVSSETLETFFDRAVQMNDETIVELVEVRQPLEVQSAILAARRRTEEDIAGMSGLMTAMRQRLHDFEVYARLDIEFHLRLAQAAHNQMLYLLIASIRETLAEAALAGLRRRQNLAELERVQALHEAILDAVRAGDTETAGAAMRRHFAETIAGLLAGEQRHHP